MSAWRIKAIQLDAMKEGTRRAAGYCSGVKDDYCAERVLAAAEQLTIDQL